jgi:hypothetical protein
MMLHPHYAGARLQRRRPSSRKPIKRTDHPDRSGNRQRGPDRRAGPGWLAVGLRADRATVSAPGHQPHRTNDGRPGACRGPAQEMPSRRSEASRVLTRRAAVVELALPDRGNTAIDFGCASRPAVARRAPDVDADTLTVRRRTDEPARPPAPDPVERRELGDALEAAMANRPDQRAAIVLRYESGPPHSTRLARSWVFQVTPDRRPPCQERARSPVDGVRLGLAISDCGGTEPAATPHKPD